MKGFRKISVMICVIALVVASLSYYPSNVKAVSYDSLSYTSLGGDISYSKLSDGIEGMSPASPELLDAGQTLLFAYAATNTNVTLSLNGQQVTASDGRVVELTNSVAKVNPQKFEDNSYTLVTISSSKGTSEYVIKKGNPTSGGEVPTGSQEDNTTPGGQQPSQGGQTTVAPVQTTPVPVATSLPKKLLGLDATNKSGSDTIDNAIMFAWAGADDTANVDGYDPTVTATAIYIYKNGSLVTKIGNATKGGVIGGLSAGTYTAKAVNINSKGEGPASETVTFTVTGDVLDYTYPVNCIGPKTPNGLNYITGNPEVPADNPAQADNKLGISWAASSTPNIPAYDSSVVGYNLYLFDAKTGKPYRRVHVEGADTSSIILESVSAGEYIACLSAINAAGEESALAATSFGQNSKVTVKGVTLDNAQSFDMPDQPALPVGLSILTEGIQYGFTVSWSADATFEGQTLNLYVDGVCIKCGINGGEPAYYENRLAAGTYKVEVKTQYTDNHVESFGLSKTITIEGDPGLDTKTPAELADPTYIPYTGSTEPQTTPQGGDVNPTTPQGGDVNPTTPQGGDVNPTTPQGGDVNPTTPQGGDVKPTTTESSDVNPTTSAKVDQTTGKPVVTEKPTSDKINPTKVVKVGKVSIKSATKKKNAKKVSVIFKKITGAKKYKVQVSNSRKFKKLLLKKTVKKVSVKLSSSRFKKAKKLFVRVKAVKVVAKKTYEGAWSKPKRVRIKK